MSVILFQVQKLMKLVVARIFLSEIKNFKNTSAVTRLLFLDDGIEKRTRYNLNDCFCACVVNI